MMKKLLYILIVMLSLASISNTYGHDLKMALFNIQQDKGETTCFIRADRLNLIKALDYSLSNPLIETYLNQHFSLIFDGVRSELIVEGYDLKPDFIEIKVKVENARPNPTEIRVKNDFLIAELKGHINVVRFNLHNKTRSFRLNSDRTETIVQYDNP